MIRRAGSLLLMFLTVGLVWAAPPAPPDPSGYQVVIRYQIAAFRTERIRQYEEMTSWFKSLGFKRDPDDVSEDEADNPDHVRMKGTVPARSVPKLLLERHVRALLLVPESAKLPDKDARVRVDLTLRSGLPPEKQRDLGRQTAEVLAGIGFQPAVGFDNRGETRLLGSLPAAALDQLLEDTRKLPGADKIGPPFRSIPNAVRIVTVRPDLPIPTGPLPEPKIAPGQERLSPELRALLADAERAAEPTRLEVLLSYTPAPDDRRWVKPLTLTGVTLEGRMGSVVTVRADKPAVAVPLAAVPLVVGVRLPRIAQSTPLPGRDARTVKFKPLEASGVARLHALNKRGQGMRLALVAADFTGWESLRGRTEGKIALPDPILFDMTRERNRNLQPDPFPPAGKGEVGPGTVEARALLRAAPEADLTLVRIDPSAPYMLELLARSICGQPYRSFTLDQRNDEIRTEADALDVRKADLIEERREALNDLREDDEPRKRREAYFRRQAEYDRDAKAHQGKVDRYVQFLRDVQGLRGIRVVANSLVWGNGFPVDGSSSLSRLLDDHPFKWALWFQAAGDTRGQAWSGNFRDADGNGILEFAPVDQPLPKDRWTPELNFLAWQPPEGRLTDIPAGTPLRIALQWREAHDPAPLRVGEDVYREPLAYFRIVLFHQPDPQGKKQPADDLEMVAQSSGIPQRVSQTLSGATYEQVVELKVPRAGRYAVRIEGTLPSGIFAPGENRLPINRRVGEVRPRLFVQTLGGAGRAVWVDYVTEVGSLGMPADAGLAVTVGSADRAGRPEPTSAEGPPYNLTLLTKPDILAYAEGEGTGVAAAFAAGLVASAHTGGVPLTTFRETLRVRKGGLLRVPDRDLGDSSPKTRPADCPLPLPRAPGEKSRPPVSDKR
jgi:hypothetical protein